MFQSKFVVLPSRSKAATVLRKFCWKKMPWKFLISSKPEVITSPIGSLTDLLQKSSQASLRPAACNVKTKRRLIIVIKSKNH